MKICHFKGIYIADRQKRSTSSKWTNDNWNDNFDHKQVKFCAVLMHLLYKYHFKQISIFVIRQVREANWAIFPQTCAISIRLLDIAHKKCSCWGKTL